MAEFCDFVFEEIYNEIVKHSNEYSMEKDIDIIIALEEVKNEIIELFKFYRPVKLDDYEYGLSANFEKDHHLIIKEAEDKSKVQEYCKNEIGVWRCSNYNSVGINCESMCLIFKYGILFAPVVHSWGCEALDYSAVTQIQDHIKQEKYNQDNALSRQSDKESNLSTLIPSTSIPSNVTPVCTNNSMIYSDEPEKLYNKILERANEYSRENDIMHHLVKAKSDVLRILETHRPKKLCDYEYGLSKTLKKEHRIIIKEFGDKSKVREYWKDFNGWWWCIERNSKRIRCRAKQLKFEYGILFAPILHNDGCDVQEYSEVMQIQDLFRQGKPHEVQNLLRRRNRKKFQSQMVPTSAHKKIKFSTAAATSMAYSSKTEKLYAELLAHVNEYSAEKIINIEQEKAKLEIFDILKTHRPVKICDYETGLFRFSNENFCLRIKEPTDNLKIRVYCKENDGWRCLNHFSITIKCSAMYLKLMHGILFAPILHSIGCDAKEYTQTQDYQDYELLRHQNQKTFSTNIFSFSTSKNDFRLSKPEKSSKHTMTYSDESKKLLTEIMQHINEYSLQDIKVVFSVKAKLKIINLLKTHRPIKLSDNEYGLSRFLKDDHRIIVKEDNDKSKVREYFKEKNGAWRCCNQSNKIIKCRAMYSKFLFGILFAPIEHSNECKTREYSSVLQVQNLLKERKSFGLQSKGNRRKTAKLMSSNPTNKQIAVSIDKMKDQSIPQISHASHLQCNEIDCDRELLSPHKCSQLSSITNCE